MTQPLDKIDIKILNALQANSRLTADQLSEQIPLSSSAIMRRLRDLRKSGIISHEIAVVGESLRETRLNVLIFVQLDNHGTRHISDLRRTILATEQVQQYLEISGPHDLVIAGSWKDMAEFNAFLDAELASNSVVRRYETCFIKRQLKSSFAIPLDETDVD